MKWVSKQAYVILQCSAKLPYSCSPKLLFRSRCAYIYVAHACMLGQNHVQFHLVRGMYVRTYVHLKMTCKIFKTLAWASWKKMMQALQKFAPYYSHL